MSLTELIVSLAIGGMLMAAVAVAVESGARSLACNRQYALDVHTAARVLHNITSAIRCAEYIKLEGAAPHGSGRKAKSLTVQPPPLDGTLPPRIAYRWDPSNMVLIRHENADDDSPGAQTGQIALRDIEFYTQEETDEGGGSIIRAVTITVTAGQDSERPVTLTATARPRQKL